MTRRDEAAALAEAMIRFRRARSSNFPAGIFGETGWEFLLALFVADAHGESTSGRAICNATGMSEASVSRWLKYLASEGLVDGDGSGDLDDRLVMSSVAIDGMETLLQQAKDLRQELVPDL